MEDKRRCGVTFPGGKSLRGLEASGAGAAAFSWTHVWEMAALGRMDVLLHCCQTLGYSRIPRLISWGEKGMAMVKLERQLQRKRPEAETAVPVDEELASP